MLTNYIKGVRKAIFTGFCVATAGCAGFPLEGPNLSKDFGKARVVSEILAGTVQFDTPKPLKPSPVLLSEKPDDQGSLPADLFSAFPIHNGPINDQVVFDGGRGVITAGEDGKVNITRLSNTGVTTQTIFQGSRPVLALGLSADASRLAIARFSAVFVINLKTRRLESTQVSLEGRITALTWDPLGEYLAIGRSDGDVFLWSNGDPNSPSAGKVESYTGPTSPIESLLFHPGGGVLFGAERAGKIYAWQLIRTDREIGLRDDDAIIDQKLTGSRQVSATADGARLDQLWLNKDASLLLGGGADGKVRIWKVRGFEKIGETIASNGSVATLSGAEFSSQTVIASAGREARLRLWCLRGDSQPADLQLLAESVLLREPFTQLSFSSGGEILWGAQKTGNLVRFQAAKNPTILRAIRGCGADR